MDGSSWTSTNKWICFRAWQQSTEIWTDIQRGTFYSKSFTLLLYYASLEKFTLTTQLWKNLQTDSNGVCYSRTLFRMSKTARTANENIRLAENITLYVLPFLNMPWNESVSKIWFLAKYEQLNCISGDGEKNLQFLFPIPLPLLPNRSKKNAMLESLLGDTTLCHGPWTTDA